jgi:hypothetical protein
MTSRLVGPAEAAERAMAFAFTTGVRAWEDAHFSGMGGVSIRR